MPDLNLVATSDSERKKATTDISASGMFYLWIVPMSFVSDQ